MVVPVLISWRILYPETEFHERRSKVESNEIASRVPNGNFRLWSKHRYACTRYTATIDEDVPRAKVTVVVIAIVSPCRVRNFRVQRPRFKMNEFESSQGVTRQIDAIERYAAKQILPRTRVNFHRLLFTIGPATLVDLLVRIKRYSNSKRLKIKIIRRLEQTGKASVSRSTPEN